MSRYLTFVKPRFDVYIDVSWQIRAILAEHTPIVEPLSLDEAYLDVTENLQGIASAAEIAERIRAKIRRSAPRRPREAHRRRPDGRLTASVPYGD
jgi:nucleotidyltransferase/DNA polymerase involved in DNA repair